MLFLLIFPLLLNLVYSSTFPCGPSFVPCESKVFGIKTAKGRLTGNDFTFEKEDAKKVEIGKSFTKEKLGSAALSARRQIEIMFNETEKNAATTLKESQFSSGELSWLRFSRSDQYSNLSSVESLHLISTQNTEIADICPVSQISECIAGKYRSYSGHCNNVVSPLNGAVYEPLKRLLPAEYKDGISEPRSAVSGSELPSPLTLSKLFTPSPNGHASCSLMLAQWAAFVYDDLAQISSNRIVKDPLFGGEHLPLPCCSNSFKHSECFPITADNNTDVTTQECVSYARSMVVPRENCTLGQREQGNMVSGYLDASHIYGSVTDTVNRLRLFRDGKLALRPTPGLTTKYGIPPAATQAETDCRSRSQVTPCFLAGSHRINFLPSSTALYTLWMRQHNFIADNLKRVNPHWSDERLFQEARRVVIGQIQHITYHEFLPSIVGKENMAKFSLRLRNHGYESSYDMSKDGSVLNVFASTVGQFFLTLLPDDVMSMNPDGSIARRDSLGKIYNDPSVLYQRGRVEALLRGLLLSPILKPGLHMTPELKNAFGRQSSSASVRGMDLAALIIQMGRDHGIAGYVKWRKFCRLENLQSFESLATQFKPSVNITELESIYTTPEDIDLFVGGLAEKPTPGALLGPTFACLFAAQMERTKRGDRFWHENFFLPAAFSEGQLDEIRKSSLARVICDNSDGIHSVQQKTFSMPDDYGNCPIACDSPIIDRLDFNQWKDAEPEKSLPITKETLEKAIRLGVEQYTRLQESEGRRISQLPIPSAASQSAVFSHASLMAPKKESIDIARTAAVLREATQILVSGNGLSAEERFPSDLDIQSLQHLLPQIDVQSIVGNFTPFLGREPLPKEQCLPQPLPCDHTTKYRSHSGWCNNLKNPQMGNAFMQMRRLLEPAYDDGFDSPRTLSHSGGVLPSARTISNAIHADAPIFHVKFSHMLMQFGQILDHDMMHSPIARGPNNSILNCSRCDSQDTLSIHCFPIRIDKGDPFFPHKHDDGSPRCMPFARSLLGQLSLGYRNQLNQLTSFLDASSIYGSTECEANRLRLFSQGKMNFSDIGFNKEALPQGNQERDCRSVLNSPNKKCFIAGDERSNEQPGLTVIHTVLLREHNRIASQLARINNFWTDDQLYQEARRINIARIQHVIYSEWLPVVLGCETMSKYNLMPKKAGYFEEYDDTCDPAISQEMSTAAFRFGHTLIRAQFPRMNDQFVNMSEPVKIKVSSAVLLGSTVLYKNECKMAGIDHFSNPSPVYDQNAGHIESLLMGLLGSESMAFDRHITDAVRNHLFAKPGGPLTGIDLPAVNIQRARDHGVKGYNAYRAYCGLRRVNTFDELRDVMESEAIEALKSVYDHVEDIDIFPGIMSEKSMKGALVGPTLGCIIGEQMQRLKKCDRFYYETADPMVRFTPDQLAEIRKTSLAKIICENSKFANKIQPNVFLLPDDLANSPMSCSEFPETDLYKWLDRKFCVLDHRIVNLGKTKTITPCVSCTCTLEGAECHSMTVDCDRLLEDFSIAEVRKDPVCMMQCSAKILSRR